MPTETKIKHGSSPLVVLNESHYIDPLFTDVVDWKLIQTHWQDLIRVTLSIQAGKLMPSTILRRLGSNSRKNRLYQAFQALGQVVRTLFLLQYISDRALRQEITACTNIVEGYHNFLDWLFFGKQGVITDQDPEVKLSGSRAGTA